MSNSATTTSSTRTSARQMKSGESMRPAGEVLPSHLLALDAALRRIEDALQARQRPAVCDSSRTIRVVGEFSSGKSRMLAELLADRVPEKLRPVSALSEETKLPLEITCGEQLELSLVRRESDFKVDQEVQTIARFDVFPSRHELGAKQVDPKFHRLRLTVPGIPLLTPNRSDDASSGPLAVYLIDTPGWNGAGDDPTRNALLEADQPALVWVCNQSRLQHKDSLNEIRDVLEVVAENVMKDIALLICVTRWNEEPGSRQVLDGFMAGIGDIISDILPDEEALIPLSEPLCIDFGSCSEAELVQFRQRFWSEISQALGAGAVAEQPRTPDFAAVIRDWNLLPRIREAVAHIESVEKLLENYREKDGFLPSMNYRRLAHLSDPERRDRLVKAWEKQLALTDADRGRLGSELQLLEDTNPLSDWWNLAIAGPINQAIQAAGDALRVGYQAITRVPIAEEITLSLWLADHTHADYHRSRAALAHLRILFPESLRAAITAASEELEVKIVSTLIGTSIYSHALLQS